MRRAKGFSSKLTGARVPGGGILGAMEGTSRIPERIHDDLPGIVASWRESRGGDDVEDGAYSRLVTGMEELVLIFIEFLRSPESVETFSRGGRIRALVREAAQSQHELGRDAVGVIEDFSVLRRGLCPSVGKGVGRSEKHKRELPARQYIVCRLL